MPKYGNSAPCSQEWNFSKKFHLIEKASRFRLQRALNHSQTLSLSQVMQENIFWLIMPKYGNLAPGSQKLNFSKKLNFLERPPDFASNEPSTTPDIKFKSSYARKRDQRCPFIIVNFIIVKLHYCEKHVRW